MGWDVWSGVILDPDHCVTFYFLAMYSRAIVPYAAKAVKRYYRYKTVTPKRLFSPAVKVVAGRAIKYGPKMVRLATTLQRGFRKRKWHSSRREFLRSVGTTRPTPSRATGVEVTDNINLGSRTLMFRPLVKILRDNTGGQLLSQRDRDVAYLGGIKICMELRSGGANDSRPLYVNVAVVKFKCGSDNTVNTLTPTTFTSFGDWFRSDGGNSRATDFNQTLSALQFRCLPINTDECYVYLHRRFLLGPATAANGEYTMRMSKNLKIWEHYIKLKKKIRFDFNSQIPMTGQIYLAIWCDHFGTAGNQPPVDPTLVLSTRVVNYFRDPLAR